MKNTVHNTRWSAKVKIAPLQHVKGSHRAKADPVMTPKAPKPPKAKSIY